MSTRIEQLHMECIHLLLCLYILYWCTAVSGGFGASWLKVGWWGQLCIVITHMQPTACWCFSAQSHKKKRQNQCEIRTSTRVNSRSSGCNSADPIISTCKEEDCPVCVMRYFHYCRFQGVTTVIALDYTTCTVRPKCSSIGLCLGYAQCPMSLPKGQGLLASKAEPPGPEKSKNSAFGIAKVKPPPIYCWSMVCWSVSLQLGSSRFPASCMM